MLWQILVEFLIRMSFGLSVAMLLTSAKQVTSGFFRVHLWVLLGINTFAACVIYWLPNEFAEWNKLLIGLAEAAALSYAGAVMWLYERPVAGKVALLLLAITECWLGCLVGEASTAPWSTMALWWGDYVTSALLIGYVMAAMFLGHWYLNTPTMRLQPLKRLIGGMMVLSIIRAMVSAAGLELALRHGLAWNEFVVGAIALRWLAGIVGVFVLSILTWRTLKIPNTQSATGILYVAVIFVFMGELVSRLLSVKAHFPL